MHIRLVPKPRGAANRPPQLMAFSFASEVTSDPDAAVEAHRVTRALGLEATLTKRSGINVVCDPAQARELFHADTVETTVNPDSMRDRQTFVTVAPGQALEIPAQLADLVDFAYVPTPPIYFQPDPIPPSTSLYHLRLEDVAATLRAPLCHRDGTTGRGVRVAMTDSGFARHPYFERGNFMITRVSSDATSDPEIDPSGHGTGESANIFAVAPDCHVIGVKQEGRAAEVLETALENDPSIITNSWGFNIDKMSITQLEIQDRNFFNEVRDLERILAEAVADGVVVIFSAGNGHRAFPGSHKDVISIGGVTAWADGTLEASSYASSFASQFFPGRMVPDVCGIVGSAQPVGQNRFLPAHIMLPVPNGAGLEGDNLPQTSRGKGWGIFSGTSAAAPQTAGVVALMLSANPNLRPNTVKQILRDTAIDIIGGQTAMGDRAVRGNDLATGGGLIDAWEACQRAQRVTN